MYRSDVWDVLVANGGAPVEAIDWTTTAAPGDVPDTGGAPVAPEAEATSSAFLAAGILLLFVFGMSNAATPR